MSDVSDIVSVGLAHELIITAQKAGWTPKELGTLTKNEKRLHDFRQVHLGHAEIKLIECLINCDADPFVPDGSSVEEHRKGGQWKFNPAKVKLWLAKEQKGGSIEGNKLREQLKGKPILNANVLDYLLKSPHLILEEWKGKYIFFWGTIYRDRFGRLCVRYLCWNGDRWLWDFHWLEDDFGSFSPAALRAS